MALKDALIQNKATPCRFGECLSYFSEEDQKTLGTWIEDGLAVQQIVRAIRAEYPDHQMADGTLQKHIRGECRCPDNLKFKGPRA